MEMGGQQVCILQHIQDIVYSVMKWHMYICLNVCKPNCNSLTNYEMRKRLIKPFKDTACINKEHLQHLVGNEPCLKAAVWFAHLRINIHMYVYMRISTNNWFLKYERRSSISKTISLTKFPFQRRYTFSYTYIHMYKYKMQTKKMLFRKRSRGSSRTKPLTAYTYVRARLHAALYGI